MPADFDPKMLISASTMLRDGQFLKSLPLILEHLPKADPKTFKTVIDNIMHSMCYHGAWRNSGTLHEFIKFMRPFLVKWEGVNASNMATHVTRKMEIVRHVADEIAYLNRYADLRLHVSKQSGELYDDFINMQVRVRDINQMIDRSIGLATRFTKQVASKSSSISNLGSKVGYLWRKGKEVASAGVASAASAFAYAKVVGTISIEVGASIAVAAYLGAGAVGAGVGAGVHYSGLGEYVGTDWLGKKLSAACFEYKHPESVI